MDPNSGGLGFTDGRKGCRAIINRKNPVAHSPECRLKVMEQAPNNDKIAARLRRTVGRDRDFHSRNLERNEERKKRESEVQSPSEPAAMEGEGSEGASRAQVGGSASSSSPSPTAPVLTSRKREAGDQLDQARESHGNQAGGTGSGEPAGSEVRQDALPDPLARLEGIKRSAEDDPAASHYWRTGDEVVPQSQEDEKKERRINLVEDLVDALEDEAVQVCIGNGEVQMRICEEPLDLSFISNPEAELLDGALKITDVSGACSSLGDKVALCMMRSLCEVTSSEVGDPLEEAVETESIFNPGSKMGLDANGDLDRWEYDSSNATWTRFIVIPRTGFFHPSEGAAEERGALVPDCPISGTIVGPWRTVFPLSRTIGRKRPGR